MGKILRKLLLLNLLAIAVAEFTEKCPTECKCIWANGNKHADCSKSNFTDIPENVSNEIQNFDLTGNPISEITALAFVKVGLVNLKKLTMRECNLRTINRRGLSGLAIMIELDLAKNEIKSLYNDTFKEIVKIRRISLNENNIEKLEDGLFNNLEFLQYVDLSNNRIVQIGMKTFMNVPKLKSLSLDNNKLERMKVDTLSGLTSLSNLDVHDNPWRCDCYLQPFRNWFISKKLYTSPIECNEPPKVHGKLWKDLDSSDFACRPSIVFPSTSSKLTTFDTNVTLSCRVNGNPLPEVNWVRDSKIIDANYRHQGDLKYYLSESSLENSKWMNLTIIEAESTDSGEYFCVAKNPGGVEERNITLMVTQSMPGVVVPSGIDNSMMPVLIGVSCSATILLIILVILCYCCCCRRRPDKKADTSNREALIEGSVIPEMEKSLISAVNPVTKPPRRYDAPPSITSGATEMSDVNKTLLDTDSVFAHNDDEKRSLDFEHAKRSQDALNVEYGRADGRAYPPDLLSFPARAAQISPAASNASTVPDTTRLPPQLNPISPIHSPIYGMTTAQNLFRTLPYSRSQSPFTAPITPPVVTPRQGYVTIPRRPRVPSWSSTASTQMLPSSEAQEPLYDNLGLRTTADGSSVISLNKTGLEQQFSPMRNRPLPATPPVYPNQVYYAPIKEQELAPSPVPHQYATNPRNSIASQLSTQLSTPGPQEPANPRMSWTAKNTSTPQPEPRRALFNNSDAPSHVSDTSTLSRRGKPETGSLRRNPLKAENAEERTPASPSREESKPNDSTASVNPTGTMGRNGKIPPRPPPKPKKKPPVEVNSNEPLFEDEGEDGTEV